MLEEENNARLKMFQRKNETTLKPIKRLVGNQGKYVGRKKKNMKIGNRNKYKRIKKEIN